MSDLKLEEELGRGNYGTVKRVLHTPTNVHMAMKVSRSFSLGLSGSVDRRSEPASHVVCMFFFISRLCLECHCCRSASAYGQTVTAC